MRPLPAAEFSCSEELACLLGVVLADELRGDDVPGDEVPEHDEPPQATTNNRSEWRMAMTTSTTPSDMRRLYRTVNTTRDSCASFVATDRRKASRHVRPHRVKGNTTTRTAAPE